jgi:hypothetical protein
MPGCPIMFAVAAVLRDQLVHLIAALARAPAAFDAQHIELAFDGAEDEVGSVAACLFDHLVGALLCSLSQAWALAASALEAM